MATGEKIADLYAGMDIDNSQFDLKLSVVNHKLKTMTDASDNAVQKTRPLAGALQTVGLQGARIDNVGMSISNLAQAIGAARLGAIGLGLEIGTSIGNMLNKIPAVESAMRKFADAMLGTVEPASRELALTLKKNRQELEFIAAMESASSGKDPNETKKTNQEKLTEAYEKYKKGLADEKTARDIMLSNDDKRLSNSLALANATQKVNLLEMERARINAIQSKGAIEDAQKISKQIEIEGQLKQAKVAQAEAVKKAKEEELSLQEQLAEQKQAIALEDEQSAINAEKKAKTSISFESGGLSMWKSMVTNAFKGDGSTEKKQAEFDAKKAIIQRDKQLDALSKIEKAILDNKQEMALISP